MSLPGLLYLTSAKPRACKGSCATVIACACVVVESSRVPGKGVFGFVCCVAWLWAGCCAGGIEVICARQFDAWLRLVHVQLGQASP